VERSEEKIKALLGDIDPATAATDPNFFAIQNRLSLAKSPDKWA